MLQHVQQIAGISEFIVIVCDELEEMVVQLDCLSGVENGCARVSNEIAGNNFIIYIFLNTLEVGFGSFFDSLSEFRSACRCVENNIYIDNGDICCRNSV